MRYEEIIMDPNIYNNEEIAMSDSSEEAGEASQFFSKDGSVGKNKKQKTDYENAM